MNTKEKIAVLAEKHHGVLQTSDVVAEGLSKKALAEFVKDHGFEKASHGIYFDPSAWKDEMYLLQLRCPKTVFSHETAMFLHDLTDREPLSYTLTARTGYNPSHLTREGIKVYTIKKELFEVGLASAGTLFGNTVRVYNLERTICDMIRSRNSTDPQELQIALKRYVKRKDRNLYRLTEYAQLFRVDRIVRQYMEVLL